MTGARRVGHGGRPACGGSGPARGGRTAGPGRLSGLLLAALAVSGCGIQPTAAPVNAGVPALRTACPPSASATPATPSAGLTATSPATAAWPPPATTTASTPRNGPLSATPVPAQTLPSTPRSTVQESPMPSAPPTAPSCLMATAG